MERFKGVGGTSDDLLDEFNDLHMNSDNSDEYSDDKFEGIQEVPKYNEGWNVDDFLYHNVQLHIDNEIPDMLLKLKMQISATKTRIVLKEREMKHNVPKAKNFNWFIPRDFWAKLIDHMNMNVENRNQIIEMEKLQLFICIKLFLGIHNVYPTCFFEILKHRNTSTEIWVMTTQSGVTRLYAFILKSIDIKKNHYVMF